MEHELLPGAEARSVARPELNERRDAFLLPAQTQYWLRDRLTGPRRAGLSAQGTPQMTSTTEQMRAWTGPAILAYGFRPFFFGAAVWAALAMVLWVPMLSGHLMLPTAFDPVSWHAHEFLYGYLGAVVAGFLLTAVPNWTGRLPIVGWPLGGLAALWLAGRMAVIFSAGLPALHHVTQPADSLMASGLGILVGAGSVFAVLQLGKLLFGKVREPLEEGESATFTESALHLPGEVVPFEEIFFRNSDTIRLHAKRLELVDRCHMNIDVALSPKRLLIGDESFDPETVPFIKVESDELVIPREAMGFGDVKFMAAIGAFVGWQGALFSLMASAVVGAVVGVGLIAIGRRDWSARLPYGPYISLAAVIWIFFGLRILAVWLPEAP